MIDFKGVKTAFVMTGCFEHLLSFKQIRILKDLGAELVPVMHLCV